jgi:hypothetical protein
LDQLAKDEKVKPRTGINALEKVVIRKDPLGVVLILGNNPILVNRDKLLILFFPIRFLELSFATFFGSFGWLYRSW